jgi:WD40 repeat protein
MRTWTLVGTLAGHRGSLLLCSPFKRNEEKELTRADTVYSVACTGDRLVSGSGDRTARLWDLTTGTCLATYEGHSKLVISVATVHGVVVTASHDGKVRFFKGHGSTAFRVIPVSSLVSAMAIHGQYLVTSSSGGELIVWNVLTDG